MKKTTEITTTKKELEVELKKNSIGHTIVFTLAVSLLIFLLAFSYISVFSSNFYFRSFDGKFVIGVVDTTNFYNTKSGQLLYVSSYSDLSNILRNDEIYYAGNSGTGTGIVKNIVNNSSERYLTISSDGETEYNVSLSTLIGKVERKADFWGYIIWFIQSEYGIVVLNLALVVVVLVRVVLVATVEPSAKGRELKQKLKKQQQQYRKIKRMKKNFESTGLDADTFEVLSGEYFENKQSLAELAKKRDLSDAYKFLLKKVHDVYLSKPKLSHEDKVKITNCIELMTLSKDFDIDAEYMLTDLVLKTNVIDFDTKEFCEACVEFVENTKRTDVLVRFFTVLYVMVKTKPMIRDDNFYSVCNHLEVKLAGKSDDENTINLLTLSNNIKILLKK